MKVVAILLAVVAVALAADKYTTKYDHINVDEILTNERLYDVYIKCLLETGKCNEEGKTLKGVVPDALLTGCSKCSDTQKEASDKIIRDLIKNHPADWEALLDKYDHDKKHRKNYEKYYEKLMH